MAFEGRSVSDAIGRLPYRMALAGGWIDQPFVSRLNPSPPGSMVVVGLEPTCRFMDRAGMATSTRRIAEKLWNGILPDRAPMELVRELYKAENNGNASPSGSQDMAGLIMPGVSRLDYDHQFAGGLFPCHIETCNDPEVGQWLEQVLHVLPVAQRPDGYDPLGEQRISAEWVCRLSESGKACFAAIRAKDIEKLGASLNESMRCWEALLPCTVTHPLIEVDLLELLAHYQERYPGAMYSGCGGGYLYVVSEKPVPGTIKVKIRIAGKNGQDGSGVGSPVVSAKKRDLLMKTNRTLLGFLLLSCFGWTFTEAQIPNRAPTVADTLQTVAVSPDNRVTLSLYAPKASSVTVSGDFIQGAPPEPLTKNGDGVWSFTSNPLPPDSYTYNFNVDGITVLDTRNQNFRDNPNALFNFFDMPGPETEFMALKNVPHGRVEKVIYHSNSLNMERRMHVYLPPNFETVKGKLPVLYLLHGGGDNDISWTSAGKINLILDNLYAEGKLKNMIVVMPAGHVPGQGRVLTAMSAGPENDLFIKDFMNDLMPFVEKTYPVSTQREERAIAGFSMGGVQTLNLALWHPEDFGYVFPMATGYFPDGIQQMDDKYATVLKNVGAHPYRVMIVGRGKDDTLTAANSQATMKLLDRYGIKYEYRELPGAHSFVFARRFLASVFPLLFR